MKAPTSWRFAARKSARAESYVSARMLNAGTVKGRGVSYMETEPGWHLGYLAPEDEARAIAELRAGANV